MSSGGSVVNNVITNSTFTGNTTLFGGALATDSSTGGSNTVSLTNNTFANNIASTSGGALVNQSNGGTATSNITNCTFVGNSATSDIGGALRAVKNSGTSTINIENAIFSGNSPGSVFADLGTITSLGGNVISDSASLFSATNDKVNTNAMLGSLQDNGGQTMTFSLLASSPAIGNGISAGAPATDQRGVARPQNLTYDSGSYELRSPLKSSVSVGTSGSPSLNGNSVTFTATVSAVGLAGTPSGTVQFQDNGTNLGSPVTLSSGSAPISTSALTSGAHTITAVYNGNSTFDPSSSTVSQQVNNPAPATSGISPTAAAVGGAQFTLTVNGSNFLNGDIVRWAGSNLTTTFLNPCHLTPTIP